MVPLVLEDALSLELSSAEVFSGTPEAAAAAPPRGGGGWVGLYLVGCAGYFFGV